MRFKLSRYQVNHLTRLFFSHIEKCEETEPGQSFRFHPFTLDIPFYRLYHRYVVDNNESSVCTFHFFLLLTLAR